jgi:hypothetical protein
MKPTCGRLVGALLAACLAQPCSPACGAEEPHEPPHFSVAAPPGPLTFVVYGDTRFTQRERVANAFARRALVAGISGEQPAAILIGGDLVYAGDDPADYATFRSETADWTRQAIPLFPALGNHEFHGCHASDDASPCLENWWNAFGALRPWRWYSVSIGDSLLALILDSDASLKPGSEQRGWLEQRISDADADARISFLLILLHYPPVRDPVFPHGRDEGEVQRYLSRHAPQLRVRVIVVGSHVHNYERFSREGVTYLVSGGGGAPPHPAWRMSGELSRLPTSVNFHYLRMTLEGARLTGTMVRFDASATAGNAWSEPDRFEVTAATARP